MVAAFDASRAVALSGLIERIYAAASDPALWPEVLTDVGRAVSPGTQTLLFMSGREHLPGVLRCERTPDSVLFPFLDYYSSVNILADPCDRIFADGTVRYSHVAVDDRSFERSEFYADFFRKNRLFYSCGIKHTDVTGHLDYLSMQREKALAPFSEAETVVLELLMPHIRSALNMQAQLTAQANAIHTREAALCVFGKAVFAVDAGGHLTFATVAAEALLASADPLFVRNGRLCARDPRIDEQLQDRLHSVLGITPGFVHSRAKALLVPQRNARVNGKGTTLDARTDTRTDARTSSASLKLVFLPMRHSGLFAHATPGAIITVSGGTVDDRHFSVSREAVLCDLFDLSPTEVRIAELLGQGAEIKNIAAVLNKSEAATRFHLKCIFGKTGTTRQADLLRVLLNLPRP